MRTNPMLILGIESSCDETAASVVEDGRRILSNIIASQHDLHGPFGGVVPEVAARAHAERITAVVDQALRAAQVGPEKIDAVAVVNRPGLIGALLVGLSAAKGLAMAWERPLIAVDHIEAHVYAAHLAGFDVYPQLALIVSGGHTCLYRVTEPGQQSVIGQTRDDAAGEAFDKVAKLLGLGFPGGPALSRCAEKGNPQAIQFPRKGPAPGEQGRKGTPAMPSFDFSFSGLKTAVYYRLHPQIGPRTRVKPPEMAPLTDSGRADLAASFQETACQILIDKTLQAAEHFGFKNISVGGGVACNRRLRDLFKAQAEPKGITVFFPAPALCADNAAMSAGLAYQHYLKGTFSELSLDVDPTPKRASR